MAEKQARRGTSKLARWFDDERGFAEATSAIFVLPMIVFLIFVLIDTGVNLRYRALVDNVTQNTTRALANDGAKYWARTTVLPTSPTGAAYSPDTFTWDQYGTDQLKSLCGATGNRCKEGEQPKMVCTVANTVGDGVGARSVAATKNTRVRCEATFPYEPVSPLSKNEATSLGFNGLLNSPIKSSSTGLTTVGANG